MPKFPHKSDQSIVTDSRLGCTLALHDINNAEQPGTRVRVLLVGDVAWWSVSGEETALRSWLSSTQQSGWPHPQGHRLYAQLKKTLETSLEAENKGGDWAELFSLSFFSLSISSPGAPSAGTILVLARSWSKHCLSVSIYSSHLQDINNPFPRCALFVDAFLKMKFNCPL